MQPESVSLLLTDLAMPRKNGFELIQEVQAIKPGQPIVVMSGHLPQREQAFRRVSLHSQAVCHPNAADAVEEGLQAAEAE